MNTQSTNSINYQCENGKGGSSNPIIHYLVTGLNSLLYYIQLERVCDAPPKYLCIYQRENKKGGSVAHHTLIIIMTILYLPCILYLYLLYHILFCICYIILYQFHSIPFLFKHSIFIVIKIYRFPGNSRGRNQQKNSNLSQQPSTSFGKIVLI